MLHFLKIVYVSVATFAFLTNPARADLLDDCSQAVEANDLSAVQKISISLMSVKPFPAERLEEARNCLEFIGHGDVRYDPDTQRITFSDRALAEFAAERQRRDEQIALMESTRIERRDQVALRTIQACRQLYSRDWVVAMTSQICQPIFMETGLPD